MEEPSQQKKGTTVITVQPHDNVLAAFPYGPHGSLLDFLKGEPKVLGAVQILIALIIGGLGTIFAFSYIDLSQIFPLVFLTGYPYWGPFIFLFTGSLTLINEKFRNILARGVLAMNIVSSVVAVIGIVFILISYTQQHKFCQMPSPEGTCVIGRTLFLGILSVLLILSIVELSISVTISSFGSKCWARSHEVVFFLPSDVIQHGERPAQDEHDQLEFELQDEFSSSAITPNISTVFFGGYAFFKLRVSRSPIACQCRSHAFNKGTDGFYVPCAPVPEERQESIPPSFTFPEEETEPKPLPPTLENIGTQTESAIEDLDEEVLQYAIAQPADIEDPLLQDNALPLQVIPLPSVQILQTLPPEDLPSQTQLTEAQPVQDTQSKSLSSHVIQSYDLTSEDLPSQDVLSQEKPYQDTPSHAPSEQVMLQPSTDLDSQSNQPENQQSSEIIYQDIRTEVMDLTQDWAYKKYHGRKSPGRLSLDLGSTDKQTPRRLSLDLPNKRGQSPKRNSLDRQGKDEASPRRKSLDQQIKAWLSPKTRSLEKQVTEQLPDQQTKGEQSPKQESQTRQSEDQPAIEEQAPEEQKQDQKAEDQQDPEKKLPHGQFPDCQAKDQQIQVEETPKPLRQDLACQVPEDQNWQPQGKDFACQTTPNWQSLCQESQDWRSQGWRNKDWKAQEWQSEMQHSPNWETQELLEKEALRQKALYQDVQTQTPTVQHKLDCKFKDSQGQDKNQEDSQSRDTLKENMQIDTMQKGNIKLGDMNWTEQRPVDPPSEDINPERHPSSCQSLVQDTFLTCLSDIGSEQEVQQNASVSSSSYKEDANLTSTSCDPKDQQQSEDSD